MDLVAETTLSQWWKAYEEVSETTALGVEYWKEREDARVLFSTARYRRLHGLPADPVGKFAIADLGLKEIQPLFSSLSSLRGMQQSEHSFRGRQIRVKSHFVGMSSTDRPLFLLLSEDITDVHRTQRDLADVTREKDVLQHFFDNALDLYAAVLEIDGGDYVHVSLNRTAARYWGYSSPEQLIGKTFHEAQMSQEWVDLISAQSQLCAKNNRDCHFDVDWRRVAHVPDSPVMWLSVTLIPLGSDRFLLLGRDVTLVKQYQVELEATVVERTAALQSLNAELHAANERLREASAAEARFFAMISHEMRTPLGGMLGMMDLLEDTAMTSQQGDFLRTATMCGTQLLALINDVLDLMKMGEKKFKLEKEPFDLQDMLEEALAVVVSKADESSIELVFECAADMQRNVVGDGNRFRQIVVNLLSNAIKFSHPSSDVILKAHTVALEEGCEVRVSVQDFGVGISPDVMQAIFEPFQQAEASTARKFGGSGLGLTISKELTELMGGTIRCHTEAGKGSEFSVVIPMDMANTETVKPPVVQESVLLVVASERLGLMLRSGALAWGLLPTVARNLAEADEAIHREGRFDHILIDSKCIDVALSMNIHPGTNVAIAGCTPMKGTSVESLPFVMKPLTLSAFRRFLLADAPRGIKSAARSKKVLLPLRVLVADDNPANRFLLSSLLTGMGCSCESVQNGEEAVSAVQQRPFDCVLMDVLMPVMDGIEATERIKALPDIRQPVIIALTGQTLDTDRQQCLDAGMEDVLTKPIRRQALFRTLLKFLPMAMTSLSPVKAAPIS